MAKYRSAIAKETGSEPSPIDCFKKFHTKKDGETFSSEKAKELYGQMESMRSTATSQGSVNEWTIYREVTGEPTHGRVLGMGDGMTSKEVYGTNNTQVCSKRCMANQRQKEEEWEDRLRIMENKVNDMQQTMLQGFNLSRIPSQVDDESEDEDYQPTSEENDDEEEEDASEMENEKDGSSQDEDQDEDDGEKDGEDDNEDNSTEDGESNSEDR